MLKCGAAGSRTPVRTRDQFAFYKFSFPLIFVNCPGKNALTISYLLKFRFNDEAHRNYFAICCTL